MPVEVDEAVRPGERPADYVERLAVAKASAIGRRNPGRVVLGADTTVIVGGTILGKPESDAHAAKMLELLSGRDHTVLTGVALWLDGRQASEVASTEVRFLQLTPGEIAWYVASGEPRDKAGAYAVQGLASRFIDRIDGSYSNVVGLPVAVIHRLLKQFAGSDIEEPVTVRPETVSNNGETI